ncbi:MAG: hypothetical protein B6I20_05645 [Bacteroidetes bacterium 4572_117]|nr:MAG: hypothetical protein B6I20_05645 [Bacteroidetes bacterium 4572_117]
MPKIKRLNLGCSDFKSIITNNNYYIDKSLFIEELIQSQNAVMLFPRPRRFGKTLNLSMLKYYFDKNEPENEKLFTKLKIWQTDDEVKQHCGKYPVIFLSFKDAKANNWEDCFELISYEISKLYKQHIYLLKGDMLYDFEKNVFNQILNETASKVKYQNSLKQLSEFLQRYHSEKVVILVDEYDTPIQSGYDKYYEDVIMFMRNMLSGAYKDNIHLYKGAITGILRVSKESIFSGLNNLSVYSILDSKFSDKFGFTEPEIKQIIEDFKVKTKYSQIKEWYNGYKFGKTEDIYNPWSILNFILQPEDGFKAYWTNTSANELIKNEIKKKDADTVRKDILKLINNEPIIKDIEENFVFPDLKNDTDLLWALLFYSGYLTVNRKIALNEYELIIPNYELKIIFKKTILEWLKKDIKIIKSLLQNTANYLINNKIEEFEKGFKQIIGDTFSYYDTAKNHEYVYQSYILGLLTIIGDDYIIKSNRESGEGRYDIMLIPHDKSKNGVVIEIKQLAVKTNHNLSEKQLINKSITEAKNQIDKNKYYKELIDNKLKKENIVKVPIVFVGKEPYISLINND